MDIVEKLRMTADDDAGGVLDDAADEIERLKKPVELRYNDDGSLDEAVGPQFHLEQMDTDQWILILHDARGEVRIELSSGEWIVVTVNDDRG